MGEVSGLTTLLTRHGLNEDQAGAVAGALVAAEEAGRSLPASALTVNPVRLVHGPFGSGKTHALAAFIVSAAERLAASVGDGAKLKNAKIHRLTTHVGSKGASFQTVEHVKKKNRC